MGVLLAVIILTLLSVSSAAPVPCEDLLKVLTLDDMGKILGKWVFVAGTANNTFYLDMLRNISSVWMEFLPTPYNNTLHFTQANRLLETCLYSSSNVTTEGNTFTIEGAVISSGVFLQSCPTCLLMSYHTAFGEELHPFLYLLARERKLNASELELYNRQLECLGFPSAVFMDPEKELCPEKKEPTEETRIIRHEKKIH